MGFLIWKRGTLGLLESTSCGHSSGNPAIPRSAAINSWAKTRATSPLPASGVRAHGPNQPTFVKICPLTPPPAFRVAGRLIGRQIAGLHRTGNFRPVGSELGERGLPRRIERVFLERLLGAGEWRKRGKGGHAQDPPGAGWISCNIMSAGGLLALGGEWQVAGGEPDGGLQCGTAAFHA